MSGKGFTENGVKFNLDNPDLYHYEAFKYGNVSASDLRKEYTRLRAVANKRLARMEGTKYEKTQTYLKNKGKYTTIAQIEKEAMKQAKNMPKEVQQLYINSHIAKKTADLYKMLTSRTGSITGMQQVERETVETLREHGFTFINRNNLKQFGEYMEFLRVLHRGRNFDSERAVDLFGTATKKGIDPQEIAHDYEYWKQHEEELAKTPKIKNAKKRTAEEYKKLLEKS